MIESRVPKSNPRAENPKWRQRKGFNKVLLASTRMMFTMALDLRLDTWGVGVLTRREG